MESSTSQTPWVRPVKEPTREQRLEKSLARKGYLTDKAIRRYTLAGYYGEPARQAELARKRKASGASPSRRNPKKEIIDLSDF